MKHSFLAAIAALIVITPLAGRSETSAVGISRSGNKLEINTNNKSINISVDSTGTGAIAVVTVNGDTLVSADVSNPVGRLNDTLLATSSFYASSQDDDQDQYEQQELDYYEHAQQTSSFYASSQDDDQDQYEQQELDYYEHAQQMQMRSQLTAIVIVAIIFGAITLIVVACLVIYYMNRRRRLRVIEKAIENGYQLPDSFYSGKTVVPNYAAPEGQPTPAPNGNMMPAFQYANEHEMRQGVTLAIVGLGLILFFALLGVDFLAALSVIPFLFGLAKIFIPYLRRNRSNPPTPPMPNIPQQSAPQPADSRQQQPETGNTTTMPPTFNHGENAGTDSENKDGENK